MNVRNNGSRQRIGITSRLRDVQRRIDRANRDLSRLYAERLSLWKQGRELEPAMKHKELARACGPEVHEDAVSQALMKARRQAS